MATSKSRYQVRGPSGAVVHATGATAGGFFDNTDDAIAACRLLNDQQDQSFQYVVTTVIHPTN